TTTPIESPLADNSYLEIIGDMELMNKLKAKKYDVGIAEAFMLTEYSLAIFYFLEIPKTIATHSQPMSPVQLYLLGVMDRMKSGNFLASVGQPTLLITNDEERRKIIGTQIGDHRANQLEKRGREIWEHCENQKSKKLSQHKTQDTLYQKLADEKYGGKIFPGWAPIPCVPWQSQKFQQQKINLTKAFPLLSVKSEPMQNDWTMESRTDHCF
uniref:SAM-dependent methyltransferase n=1 Tax=Globodera pallida TaxID=36090 RepID=A0A183CM32_GLOPA